LSFPSPCFHSNFIHHHVTNAGNIIPGKHRGKGKWSHASNNTDSESNIDILGERIDKL